MSAAAGAEGEERSRAELLAWLAALLAFALPSALLLRALPDPLARASTRLALAALGLAWVGWLLLGARAISPRRAAAAVGGAAGILVAILLAQRAPTVWEQSDVAWHGAKVALAARGLLLEDPILRVPTIYPFCFGALLGLPVALGASVRFALWAIAPLSLAGALFGHWRLARQLGPALPAAWATLALPAVFYAPHLVYTPYLPSPFNLAQPALFLGLALLVRGWREDAPRALAGGAFLLGLAGLCWYAHLVWIGLLVLALVAVRRRALPPIALGAALPAAALAWHLVSLARAGVLGSAGITGAHAAPELVERLGGVLRNLASLSGGESLARAPAWIGPAVLATAALAWSRRARPRPAGAWIPLAAVAVLLGVLVWAGLSMSFWEPFSWRYAYVAAALVLAWSASARPWRPRAARALTPAFGLACVALSWVPARALVLVDLSRRFDARFAAEIEPLAAAVARTTERDEPVLASTRSWELVLARGAPRPSLVDQYGGTYKYAPAALAAPRWQLLKQLERGRSLDETVERLRALGFRVALVGRADARAHAGWRALAEGYEPLYESEAWRLLDLERPGGRAWR